MGAHDGSSDYDVVVIGAGVVGLACAWRAAERGLRVLCVDREEPGAGASRIAAGMLAPTTEADFGEEVLSRLNREGATAWPGFREALERSAGAPVLFRASGALEVAVDRDDAEHLRQRIALQRSLGLDVEWLSGREARRLEPALSPRVQGAISAPGEAHVDPRAVIAALVVALERAGGELRTGTDASVRVERDHVAGVELADGNSVTAPAVVAAAGHATAAIRGLEPGLAPPVRPVKGQILRLRRSPGGPALAERLIRTPRCYVVDRESGEVVVGGTVEERGEDRSVTAGAVLALLDAAREALPDVDELELVEASAGLRPGSPDNGPAVGRHGPEGLVWATGHFRHGVLLAPITAEAVAGALTGEPMPEVLAPFAPARFATAPPDEPSTNATPAVVGAASPTGAAAPAGAAR